MNEESTSELIHVSNEQLMRSEITFLDQFILVLEISLIFLTGYSIIVLLDAVFEGLDLYEPLAGLFLGEPGVGSFDGGSFKAIVRIGFVFNILLFGVTLVFGAWMRRTRDNWTWKDLGYTFKTEKYSFWEILRHGVILGLVVLLVQFLVMTTAVYIMSGFNLEAALQLHTFVNEKTGSFFTLRQLFAEFYFGFIEMGFIWPLTAGFFFFSYCNTSLRAKFPEGVANLLSTLFYVFYLAFFFMITTRGKLLILGQLLISPTFWAQMFVFFVMLFISFSAFSETKSLLLPFILNFVFNAGLTLIRSLNALLFSHPNSLMLLPYVACAFVAGGWYFYKKEDFSTIRLGLKQVFTSEKQSKLSTIAALTFTFVLLSFLFPSILELVVSTRIDLTLPITFPSWVLSVTYGFTYGLIIVLSVMILTYEPSRVHDVLLVKKPDGLPLAAHIRLFQSDQVLISGFFTALSAVSDELEARPSEIRSIKRGEREIIIEEGVFTRVIALVDKDVPSIRASIAQKHRKFEILHQSTLSEWLGEEMKEAKRFVEDLGTISIKFDFPQQTKWLAALTALFSPLMIALISLL